MITSANQWLRFRQATRTPKHRHQIVEANGDFDVLGFSLQAELNYSNILNMLDLAGLPVSAPDRERSGEAAGEGDPLFADLVPERRVIDAESFLGGEAQDAAKQFRDQVIALKADGAKFDACLTAADTQAALDRDIACGLADNPSPFAISRWRANSVSAVVSQRYGLGGCDFALNAASATGGQACSSPSGRPCAAVSVGAATGTSL